MGASRESWSSLTPPLIPFSLRLSPILLPLSLVPFFSLYSTFRKCVLPHLFVSSPSPPLSPPPPLSPCPSAYSNEYSPLLQPVIRSFWCQQKCHCHFLHSLEAAQESNLGSLLVPTVSISQSSKNHPYTLPGLPLLSFFTTNNARDSAQNF